MTRYTDDTSSFMYKTCILAVYGVVKVTHYRKLLWMFSSPHHPPGFLGFFKFPLIVSFAGLRMRATKVISKFAYPLSEPLWFDRDLFLKTVSANHCSAILVSGTSHYRLPHTRYMFTLRLRYSNTLIKPPHFS